ncbi:amidohydrolase [Ferroglobus placidus DSM 10642]|uniref:Amidohydrolase n=1 Tax=Ferroglobus placidus (strain DSM 10642 / AEDII12DO) TaxID=589924 RepID=D3S1B8_FERPA|nr:amidohydrolase family protein [Ferroglobus placidus]ADC66382.1 amidohydrolase [Ferroglobus placidus DSM 10642]
MKCIFVESGETGEIVFEENRIVFEPKKVEPSYVIFRSFVNAHTHLGDSVAKDPERTSLEKLVGPGGYKFKVLSSAKEEEIVEEMKRSIELAYKSGATEVFDFREGGIKGFELLTRADRRGIVRAFTRPGNLEEAEILSEKSYGFGFSSVRDHDISFLEECREIAKKKKILFAIHAGEKDNEDVEGAIALEPDILVHMNMAEKSLLKKAMDEGIIIVSCARSNAFFGLLNLENLRILSEYDNWMIGTDNVMISTPSILDEFKFLSYFVPEEKIYRAVARGKSFVVARMDKIHGSRNYLRSLKRLESCDIVMIAEIEFG